MFKNPYAFFFDLETTGLPRKGGTQMPGIYSLYGAIVDLRDPSLQVIEDIELAIRVDDYQTWSTFGYENAVAHGFVSVQENGIAYVLEEGGTVNLSYSTDRSWKAPAGAMLELRHFLAKYKVEAEDGRVYLPMPAGHNVARFDLPVLSRLLWTAANIAIDDVLDYHSLDTCVAAGFDLVVANDVTDRVRLEKVAPTLGIPYEKGHDAKADTLMTIEVAKRLIGRAQVAGKLQVV